MNKIGFFLLLLFSLNSLASRARLQALNSSFHLLDPQHLYTQPLDINELDDFVSLESGLTTPSGTSDGAEGLWLTSLSDKSRVAAGLGHQQASVVDARLLMNTLGGTSYQLQQNPVHLIYGSTVDMTSYAFGMYYSNAEEKVASTRESSAGITYGIELGRLQVYGEIGLVNSAEAAGRRFDGSGYVSGAVEFSTEGLSFLVSLSRSESKSLTGTTENDAYLRQILNVALVDSSLKEEDDFFWGAQVVSTRIECHTAASADCSTTSSALKMPLTIGFEVQSADWLTFRSSLSQSVLLNQSKNELGTFSEIGPGANDTAVALGVGLKFNRLMIDGTLTTAATQVVNSTALLSQVAVTSHF